MSHSPRSAKRSSDGDGGSGGGGDDDVGSLPLSWKEARSRLCGTLEAYLTDPPKFSRKKDPPQDNSNNGETRGSLVSWWIERDLDLYAAAIPLSSVLFILACLSLSKRGAESSTLRTTSVDPIVYRAQLAASCLLLVGSIFSLWLVRRRRYLRANDSDKAKQREISRFLKLMKRAAELSEQHDFIGNRDQVAAEYSGDAMSDVYPVYRISSRNNNTSENNNNKSASPVCLWSRIPSLLIVEGDFVALQIGDRCPADCVLLDDSSLNGSSNNNNNKNVFVSQDQILTRDLFASTEDEFVSTLPRGRTTLPNDSKHLRTLCNGMHVFKAIRTPLDSFIRRPPLEPKPSLVSRQLQTIRGNLLVLAAIFFFLTTIIVFSRPDAASGDLALVIPIPVLAALGVLPVAGPTFIFFLEVIGTARILTTIHPYASSTRSNNHHESSSSGAMGGLAENALLWRYFFATALSRLNLWDIAGQIQLGINVVLARSLDDPTGQHSPKLIRIPPASISLLEKLGVATAFALIDDELACDPHALPQQLLIPSGNGLKLLDLCPAYDDDSDADSESQTETHGRRGKSGESDSEDSEDDTGGTFRSSLRRKVLRRRLIRRRKQRQPEVGSINSESTDSSSYEVQFEDPTWWQHLPSLKCIGLASLLVDEFRQERVDTPAAAESEDTKATDLDAANADLVQLICNERQTSQLKALAECIGFSSEPNAGGSHGDISPFTQKRRIHSLSAGLFAGRLKLDSHERSTEQSHWWGLLRPDSTSVVVHDARTHAFQILTVGDPVSVTNLCNEAWQGEISTILPLTMEDRHTLIETTNNWKLADLDVAAFSYSPVPRTFEAELLGEKGQSTIYLLDNADPFSSLIKDRNASKEWTQIRNQIFLGVLGSLVVPRREIQRLLSVLNDAGVRFVYFSPRNMRRQKELASQMGIDVAWNCAISLRPLESGKEDPHRMTSNYADWDVNAKLPHGVSEVRSHLEEVDNVPLLVSLYTDVTKETTAEMVDIFQQYSDTVVSIGLSHLPSNDMIFATADIAVGIDVLRDNEADRAIPIQEESFSSGRALPFELDFVSSIAAHSCAFRFSGPSSVSAMAPIIERSRAALESATGATIFSAMGCISFSLFVLFSACSPGTNIPLIPSLGSVLYLQVILPSIALTMAMSESSEDSMRIVPPKNDKSMVFRRQEGMRLYTFTVLKAIPPALLAQIFQLVVFGELMIAFEPDIVSSSCRGVTNWTGVVRCNLKSHSGKARTLSGSLVLAHFVLSMIICSAGYVHRFSHVWEQPPWHGNRAWVIAVLSSIGLVVLYLFLVVEDNAGASLPWYFYLSTILSPFVSLAWIEFCKSKQITNERRSEKFRRLQFETRLGAWSPK